MLLGNALGMSPVSRTYKNYDGFPLPFCDTGIEVEVEGAEGCDEETLKFWNKERDDSLRGKHPAEFVLKAPLFGQDLFLAIKQICEQAVKFKWEINYRTSIHVHIDARDMSYEAFRAVCCLYAIVEPVLFDWIGDKRNESVFCLPWADAEGDIKKIRKLFYSTGKDFSRQSDAINRYSALNLKALQKQGSIEFRHMRTTFDLARIVDWVAMCQHIKRYAMTLEQNERLDYRLLELYSTLGTARFLADVFGERLATELLRTYTGVSLQAGVLFAQDLLSNEIQKKMGAIFCPPNCFLTPGKNPYFSKWIKLKKIKKTSKKANNDGFAPRAGGFIIEDEAANFHDPATLTNRLNAATTNPIFGRLRTRREQEEQAPPAMVHVDFEANAPDPERRLDYYDVPLGYYRHDWHADREMRGRWFFFGMDHDGHDIEAECWLTIAPDMTCGSVHAELHRLWEMRINDGVLNRELNVRIFSTADLSIFPDPWRT